MVVQAKLTVWLVDLLAESAHAGDFVVSGYGAAEAECISAVLVQGGGVALFLVHALLHFMEFGRHGFGAVMDGLAKLLLLERGTVVIV